MDENEYPIIYYGQTLEVNMDVADRSQDGLTGQKKALGKWVVEIGGRLHRMVVADYNA